ncbi:SGNH/GDSL hydrolase family protein [Dyadobacter jejuensis]|nr:SGNH/GDSL hydrolase family protein [Dyadobacter jejuensis]
MAQTNNGKTLDEQWKQAEETINKNTTGKITQAKLNDCLNIIMDLSMSLKDSLAQAKTGWEDQTIIWTGTSIPWAFGDNSYPKQVARALKCKIYNNSISGSTIIFRAPDSSQQGSYGMAGTYSQLRAAGFSQNYSYENRILAFTVPPYNGNTIVIDHGPNDMASLKSGKLGDIDSYDVRTFYGAYNQIIKKTLESNPHLRIIITTLINRYQVNGVSQEFFEKAVTAQREIAKKWGLPLLDYAQLAGVNEVTVQPGRLTSDGLHPTKEFSDRIAQISINFFKTLTP